MVITVCIQWSAKLCPLHYEFEILNVVCVCSLGLFALTVIIIMSLSFLQINRTGLVYTSNVTVVFQLVTTTNGVALVHVLLAVEGVEMSAVVFK